MTRTIELSRYFRITRRRTLHRYKTSPTVFFVPFAFAAAAQKPRSVLRHRNLYAEIACGVRTARLALAILTRAEVAGGYQASLFLPFPAILSVVPRQFRMASTIQSLQEPPGSR